MAFNDVLSVLSSGIDALGVPALNLSGFEERRIILGRGADFRDEDLAARPAETSFQIFNYLARHLGADFHRNADGTAEYTDNRQHVHFTLEQVIQKNHFKDALETPDVMVIYDGHSRYGRGTCFDPATPPTQEHGEHWENGSGDTDGIFRLGYPFVAVDLGDIRHHQYTCHPLRVEDPTPPTADRDLDARRGLSRFTMPPDLRGFVAADHVSPSHQYWGFRAGGDINLLMRADWQNTLSTPFDLGATSLNCRCFCHFGCDSRDHFRAIVRGTDRKNWVRDSPPTTRFAYFTTNLSDCQATPFWLRCWLTYRHENAFQSWSASLENAKQRTNNMLNSASAGYLIY